MTGFQLIAHQRDEIGKLYVNQTTSEAHVDVPVGQQVQYQIAVFSVRKGNGILGSGVEYLQRLTLGEGLTVGVMPTTATSTATTTTINSMCLLILPCMHEI